MRSKRQPHSYQIFRGPLPGTGYIQALLLLLFFGGRPPGHMHSTIFPDSCILHSIFLLLPLSGFFGSGHHFGTLLLVPGCFVSRDFFAQFEIINPVFEIVEFQQDHLIHPILPLIGYVNRIPVALRVFWHLRSFPRFLLSIRLFLSRVTFCSVRNHRSGIQDR